MVDRWDDLPGSVLCAEEILTMRRHGPMRQAAQCIGHPSCLPEIGMASPAAREVQLKTNPFPEREIFLQVASDQVDDISAGQPTGEPLEKVIRHCLVDHVVQPLSPVSESFPFSYMSQGLSPRYSSTACRTRSRARCSRTYRLVSVMLRSSQSALDSTPSTSRRTSTSRNVVGNS